MQKVLLHTKSGFSLIEILVAISVFSVFVLAATGVTSIVSRNTRHAGNTERATVLAEEAIEVSRNLRDSAPGFADLPDGTYGLQVSGNQWNLSGATDVSGIFTRSTTISTINGSQKKIRTNISWVDQVSGSNSVSLSTYLTNWHAPLSIGVTFDKVVVNHGGAKVPSDFLPVNLTTLAWDNSVEPPVQSIVTVPIVFSPSTMSLGPGTYTFSTSSDPSYSVSLSSDCGASSITLANGDAKLCNITYEEYVVPTITLPTVTAVTSTTTTLGANVTSLGNPASISARGTCWGTTPLPTTNCIAQGATTTGVFTQARTGFTANTLYYYRGYATNSTGTGYSADGTFTTSPETMTPTVDTPVASVVKSTTATLGATVRSLGLPASISARGVCYSTGSNPSLTSGATCVTATLSQTTPSAFTVSVSSLTPNTLYHYRGYATNSTGTGYTADTTFTPASTIAFVGALGVSGTTASIPTHNVGDLLIAFAYRSGSTGAPTIPAGWTLISSAGGANANASTLAYRVATGADSGSGWTNATGIVVQVYRGVSVSPIGANINQNGAGSTVTYPAFGLTVTNGTSWIIGFGGHRSTNTTIETPPTGMISRLDFVGAAEIVGHSTNTGVSAWNTGSVSVGGTSSGWMTRVLEIKSQ